MATIIRPPEGDGYRPRISQNCDSVRVIGGLFEGCYGTVVSRVGQFHDEGQLVIEPGYYVTLDDGRRVTIRWDMVEPMG